MTILRHPRWDALFIALALLHGLLLIMVPSVWLIALGCWWNANTISHNFIHLPFFRSRPGNAVFSAGLSLLLGVPQTLWRERHLAHHGGANWRPRWSSALLVEAVLVAALWLTLIVLVPRFFCSAYLPGSILGLCLCQLQGYYEHVRGPVSHYGWLYNFLFFNDGYHREHHACPAQHWTRLSHRPRHPGRSSRWPAVLRWLELTSLDSLERLVLKSPRLQRFVLRTHERAFRRVLSRLPAMRTVGIIGGGLFPRSALVLQRLLPDAHLSVLDANAENLRRARCFVEGRVEFRHEFYQSRGGQAHFRKFEQGARMPRPPLRIPPKQADEASALQHESAPLGTDEWTSGLDLLVIPLAFVGDRTAIYRDPPARCVLVHDWLWRRRPGGTIISVPLLKCLNLVRR